MAKYTIKNTTILHNKKAYHIGAEIELTDEERDKLIDYIVPVKVIQKSTTEVSTPKTSKTAKKTEKVAEEIAEEVVADSIGNEKKEDTHGTETVQTTSN